MTSITPSPGSSKISGSNPTPSLKIRAHRLRDRHFGNQWPEQIEDHWDYRDFIADENWRRDWISFDSLAYDPAANRVYAGLTSFDADIFWAWDRNRESFIDLDYARVRDPFDAKFHRALVRDPRNGFIYAAPALLHDIDKFNEAPGAAIIRYNPATGELVKLGIPIPHVYIQAMVLDAERDCLYCQTFTPEYLVRFDLKTNESRVLGVTSAGASLTQGENIVLDDDGCVWGTWQLTRAWQHTPGVDSYRLYRYDPRAERIDYLKTGLPYPIGRHGYAKPEGFFNLGTGSLFVSGNHGTLYRVDPTTGEAVLLFRPIDDEGRGRRSRLTSLALAPDGMAYGVTGRDGECEILRFDPRAERYELLGALREAAEGPAAWQIHDVLVTPDGTLFAGENDNPHRSGYLWEVKL